MVCPVTVQLEGCSSGRGGRVAAAPARAGVGFGSEPWRRRARPRAVPVGGAPQPRGPCRGGKAVAQLAGCGLQREKRKRCVPPMRCFNGPCGPLGRVWGQSRAAGVSVAGVCNACGTDRSRGLRTCRLWSGFGLPGMAQPRSLGIRPVRDACERFSECKCPILSALWVFGGCILSRESAGEVLRGLVLGIQIECRHGVWQGCL